ncbi:unnamed protein product [Boreogadus saida]
MTQTSYSFTPFKPQAVSTNQRALLSEWRLREGTLEPAGEAKVHYKVRSTGLDSSVVACVALSRETLESQQR